VGKIIKILTSALVVGILVLVGIHTASALSVTNISPVQGPVAGGQTVTIQGDFTGGFQVLQTGGSYYNSCVLGSNGRVYCFGWGYWGAIGNGSTTSYNRVPQAVDVSGVLAGKTLTQITHGTYYVCALDTDGKAYCWGNNYSGQLGNNSTDSNSSVPVAVDTTGVLAGKTLTQISGGNGKTCAIDSNSQVYCWGGSYLGDGSTAGSLVPVAVDMTGVLAGKTLAQITVGTRQVCVLDTAGKAYCWGGNDYGELGNNSTTDSTVPVAVDTTGVLAGKTLKQISAKGNTCALDTDGKAYCWGDGYLGDGSSSISTVPVAVDMTGVLAGKTLAQISVGGSHVCVLDTDGKAYCWGYNSNGEFGDGTDHNTSYVAVAVNTDGVLAGKTLVSIMASGLYHTCAIDSDGVAYCWGREYFGNLGMNTIYSVNLPAKVHTVSDGTGSALPDSYKLNFTVTFDPDGTPAECVDVVVAVGGQSLTCRTSAHVAGWVDVLVDNGITQETLADAYEYVDAGGAEVSSRWHNNKNHYKRGESTPLTFIIEHECAELDTVAVNGEVLTLEQDYTVECGVNETQITLTSGFLRTLPVDGEYPVEVVFTDGQVATDVITVSAAPTAANIATPNTGILELLSHSASVIAALIAGAGAIISGVIVMKRHIISVKTLHRR